ncbi:hypothetical protein EYB25_005255 [Talaromyces marneffei]|uniref:Serine/threonine-rich protein adg2 n=1 Tax=Talaromyces marneffei PM1 TaxID=1077442 RepID=A0A093XEM5_TALMA|nr:uncharacterized protein EYB26_007452 [Talaromyces marneffei]KAE8551370.1 hypothetical protein EYB25_005255 [Talaromyces marneffei]QGA19758.1 hypothetical protein EYB26_007452 [Talaromyces marneffei]
MTPVAIITVLLGIISLVQGLEITSPNAGDKIDIQQGLPISWIVEDTDNLTANVDIQLYWNERFQVGLTWSEPGSTVPINDSSYTFQYTRDKDYIWPKTDYVVYLYDGSNSTHKTGEFEIFNTDGRVTSTTSMPTATQKGSKKGPSASASDSVRLNSTSTRLPHHTPSASSGRPNGLAHDSVATGNMGFVEMGGSLLWGIILVYVQGGLIWT